MMLLRSSIVALIAIIGVTRSQNGDLVTSTPETTDHLDDEYRPWERDVKSTPWISLERMGIQMVTSEFNVNIPNVKWLVLDGNQIETIPSEAFKNFPDLTYLSLKGNVIYNIASDAFTYLKKLEVLDLDDNNMRNQFKLYGFSELSALKRLYLRNCGLRYFNLPNFMNSLNHLYLSGNELTTFVVSNETALTSLFLDNNELSYVSLSGLKSLNYLNLDGNQLTTIKRRSEVQPSHFAKHFGYSEYDAPLFLGEAFDLEYLIISSNRLETIDSGIFDEYQALVHLNLTDNKMTEVHAGTFNNLPNIEDILLDYNKISQINHRSFVNLPNLKTISLKNNRIDDVDEDAFTKLNSAANEVYLYLDNNRIHTLRTGSFRGVKSLKHIGLSGNRIHTISSQAFDDLPNLDSIVIEGELLDDISRRYMNYLSIMIDESRPYLGIPGLVLNGSIESDAFSNLTKITSITIRGNTFTDIKAKAFHSLPKLISLNLANNTIMTLSSEAFYDLPAIEDLSLDDNFISTISPDTFPKHLRRLSLSRNRVCPEFSCWHVGGLHQLEVLDVSGVTEQLKIQDFAGLSENLTVIVRATPEITIPKSSDY